MELQSCGFSAGSSPSHLEQPLGSQEWGGTRVQPPPAALPNELCVPRVGRAPGPGVLHLEEPLGLADFRVSQTQIQLLGLQLWISSLSCSKPFPGLTPFLFLLLSLLLPLLLLLLLVSLSLLFAMQPVGF